jgi:dTDP-4-amino-4,6-dideoxygalactose transaminase
MSADLVPLTPAVPLCDILGQYRTLEAEIDAAVLKVLKSGQAIGGPEVTGFEQEAAAYCGADFAIGCADGTNALLLALQALDIGPGDEVIMPPFTFFATLGSVIRCGATPIFADIDPLSYNIDPTEIAKKITPRTRAIMPVHLFGQCADMEPIWELANRHNLYVIEDAAQSFGAEYQGRRCGNLGVVSCFSFYPSKNIGTMGDAGMVTTSDPAVAKKLQALRNHGSEVKYFHKYFGWNARLDAIHAAILRVKLPHVDRWIEGRRSAAERYDRLLEQAGLNGFFHRPVRSPDRLHTFNQYVVRVAATHRDKLVKHLKTENVGCEIYYPLCLHQQECISHLGYRPGDFPHGEEAARTVLALPMYPEITLELQRRVIEVCSGYVSQQLRTVAA